MIQSVDLFLELAKTDLKLRFKRSIFGYFWALLKPLSLYLVIVTIFSSPFSPFAAEEKYPLHLISGLVFWTFFQESTISGLDILLSRKDLFDKLTFNRSIIIYSNIFTSALIFLCNILAVFILFNSKINFSPILLPNLLLFFILSYFFTIGFTFILIRIFLAFRDFRQIWEIALQLIFWLTPIIYFPSILPKNLSILQQINPLAHFLNFFRQALTSNTFNLNQSLTLILITIPIFLLGQLLSRQISNRIQQYL